MYIVLFSYVFHLSFDISYISCAEDLKLLCGLINQGVALRALCLEQPSPFLQGGAQPTSGI